MPLAAKRTKIISTVAGDEHPLGLVLRCPGQYNLMDLNLAVNFAGDKGVLSLIPVICTCPNFTRCQLLGIWTQLSCSKEMCVCQS